MTSDFGGLLKQPEFAAFALFKESPFDPEGKIIRNGSSVGIPEQTDIFPLVVNSNDMADRTSYARSLSQSPLSSASSAIEAIIKPDRTIVKANIHNNPLISKPPFPSSGISFEFLTQSLG